MEQVRHTVIIHTTNTLMQTMYTGYSKTKAQSEIQRLQAMKDVTHIFYREGKTKYQTLKG